MWKVLLLVWRGWLEEAPFLSNIQTDPVLKFMLGALNLSGAHCLMRLLLDFGDMV